MVQDTKWSQKNNSVDFEKAAKKFTAENSNSYKNSLLYSQRILQKLIDLTPLIAER